MTATLLENSFLGVIRRSYRPILMCLCDVSLEEWDRSPAHKIMADFKAQKDKLQRYGAVVLYSSLTKILMIQPGMSSSVRNPTPPGWTHPRGKALFGEDPKVCVQREVLEEVGINFP